MQETPKKEAPKKGGRRTGKVMSAKEIAAAEKKRLQEEAEEAERRAKEEEEARVKAEEEERRRKEEEEKKAAAAKKAPAKKGAKVEEEVKEEVIETPEEKKEREIKEINAEMESLKTWIDQYTGKVKLCKEQIEKITAESKEDKVMELVEKTGERKYMKNSLDERAEGLLRERKAYVLSQVKKNPETEEEEAHNIVIDGACMRTPDEDIKWAEEQEELAALAAKGGKGKPPAKKK